MEVIDALNPTVRLCRSCNQVGIQIDNPKETLPPGIIVLKCDCQHPRRVEWMACSRCENCRTRFNETQPTGRSRSTLTDHIRQNKANHADANSTMCPKAPITMTPSSKRPKHHNSFLDVLTGYPPNENDQGSQMGIVTLDSESDDDEDEPPTVDIVNMHHFRGSNFVPSEVEIDEEEEEEEEDAEEERPLEEFQPSFKHLSNILSNKEHLSELMALFDKEIHQKRKEKNQHCAEVLAWSKDAVASVANAIQFSDEEKNLNNFGLLEKHMGPASQKYFARATKGEGLMYLVSLAAFGSPRERVSQADINQAFNIAKLVFKLTRNEWGDLAAIIGSYYSQYSLHQASCALVKPNDPPKRYADSSLKAEQSCRPVVPPISPNRMRKMFVKGIHAFIPNIPLPRIEKLESIQSHAYVSIHDSLAHILAFGRHDFDCIVTASPPDNGKVELASQSPFARSKYDPSVDYHITAHPWSDGFEPNYSTKSNRGSVWIMTCSFVGNRADGSRWRYVCPVALGEDKANHQIVETKFQEEMRALDSKGGVTFYCGKAKRSVKVRVTLLVTKQDQPERRKMLCIQGIKGTYGPAFGMAGNFTVISEFLPSCGSCLQALCRKENVRDCQNCLNWSLDRRCAMSSFPPPADYPTSEEVPEGGRLQLKKLDFPMLVSAVRRTHDQLVAGIWSDKNATAYLKTHAINDETIKEILTCAAYCRNLLLAETEKESKPDQYAATMLLLEKTPEKFRRWQEPSKWTRGPSIDHVIDVLMHLLFLGLTKTVALDVHRWAKSLMLGKPTTRYAKGLLDSIYKLQVDWCRPLEYKAGTFGSWVSTDFVSFAKLMPWFYSGVPHIKQEDDGSDLPETIDLKAKALAKIWPRKVCDRWLKIRGLDHSGLVDPVRQKISNYMKQPGGPPPIRKVDTYDDVMLCVQSLHAMLARLMTKVTTDDLINEAEVFVKLFLTYFNKFESKLPKKKAKAKAKAKAKPATKETPQELKDGNVSDNDKEEDTEEQEINDEDESGKKRPAFVNKGNFLSLPRVIATMRLLGPMRNFWEGYMEGEGILRFVKPEISGGLRKNWDSNAMQKICRVKSMEQLADSPEYTLDSIDQSAPSRGYHRYSAVAKILVAFSKNLPMSGVYLDSGDFGFCLRQENKKEAFVPFEKMAHKEKETANAMEYFQWKVSTDEKMTPFNTGRIKHHVLFLPKLCGDGFVCSPKCNGIYTVISDEWQVLSRQSHFVAPTIESVAT